MNRKTLVHAVLLALAAAPWSLSHAQAFPDKPIMLVHGLAVGGQTDLSLRLMAEALQRKFGQAVVVQAKPGAAQTIGVMAVKTAKPDGYTIGHFYQGAFSTVPLLQNVGYALDDLEPVIAWQVSPQMLVVRADSPIRNLADLVAAAKAKPNEPPSFGHQGKGSVNFLAPTVFAKLAGINLLDVQFKGDADTVNAVLGGHTQLASITDVAAAPLIEAGKIRALVTYARSRSPNLPNVPTFKDQGFEVPLQPPVGIVFAPKGTPAPVIAKLHDAIKEVTEDEKMKKEFAAMKQALYYMDGKSVRAMIENERKAYEPILREAGLTRQ